MNKSKNLSGTPYHLEYLSLPEGESRRHKSRCSHYSHGTKKCLLRYGICHGSSHCPDYKETTGLISCKSTLMQEDTMNFKGVKEILLSQIEIDVLRAKKPKQEKIDKVIEDFNKTGTLDKPIVVSIKGDKYFLEDKYLRYYVANFLKLERIPAEIGTRKENNFKERLRKTGVQVEHRKYGRGIIVGSTSEEVEVQFENKETPIKLSLSICVEKNLLTIVTF